MKTQRVDLERRTKSLIDALASKNGLSADSLPAYLQRVWRISINSYWFLPTIILMGVVLLSFVTLSIDERSAFLQSPSNC